MKYKRTAAASGTTLLTAAVLAGGLLAAGPAQARTAPMSPVENEICWTVDGDIIWCAPNLHDFTDVKTGNQFAADITWAFDHGIVTGWAEDNTYRPDLPVARDAMAAFLYRLAGQPDFTPPEVSPFADVAPDHAFYPQIAWLAAEGISTGWQEEDGTSTFRPDQPVARDATAAFLYRLAGEQPIDPAVFSFADVAPDHPYRTAIAWMDQWNIADGWLEDSSYRPLQPVNRDAMAAFMYRWNIVAGTLPAYEYHS